MKSKFTQVSNYIIFDKNVSDAEFRTYIVLKSHKYGSGHVFPSQKTLSEIRGRSKKSIITHLKGLRSKGYVQYKKRGYSASNQYEFISEENYTNDVCNNNKKYTSKVKKSSPLSTQKLQPNNTETNNTEINNIDEFGKEVTEKGLRKILDKNPWLKAKRARLLKKISIK